MPSRAYRTGPGDRGEPREQRSARHRAERPVDRPRRQRPEVRLHQEHGGHRQPVPVVRVQCLGDGGARPAATAPARRTPPGGPAHPPGGARHAADGGRGDGRGAFRGPGYGEGAGRVEEGVVQGAQRGGAAQRRGEAPGRAEPRTACARRRGPSATRSATGRSVRVRAVALRPAAGPRRTGHAAAVPARRGRRAAAGSGQRVLSPVERGGQPGPVLQGAGPPAASSRSATASYAPATASRSPSRKPDGCGRARAAAGAG